MTDNSEMPVATPHEAARRQQDGALIIDVREPDEWDAGHIPDALHIPLGDLPGRIGEIPGGRQLIVACRSGARSARATQHLREQGYDATNLDGGTAGWHNAGLALEPADGHVA